MDGALALAVPTRFGQSLTVTPTDTDGTLQWESFDDEGSMWFNARISLTDGLHFSEPSNSSIATRLITMLRAIKDQHPEFFNGHQGYHVKTELDFPRDWGLGTSSTLINNLAQWAKVDPYVLLEATFGGSGYDIGCAKHNTPITYQLENNSRSIIERSFNPDFKDHLYFIYLNKKQNSRDGIAAYRKETGKNTMAFSEINAITNDMLSCSSLDTFQFLMQSHETIISKVINQIPIKTSLFNDFNGSIKSLGAWGGDFILAAYDSYPGAYFSKKGFHTIIPYADMVL